MHRLIAATSIFLFAAACSPAYQVVKQALPNPFVGQKFAVTEIEYAVETKDENKNEINSSFNEVIKDELGATLGEGAEYTIKPKITMIAEGTAMNLVRDPTKMNMTVQLIKGEEVLDEISFIRVMTKQSNASFAGIPVSGYSAKDRLGAVADEIAEEVASYVESRTAAP